MKETAKDYARGLYMLAAEERREREYLEDLRSVAQQFDSFPGYTQVLSSPAIPRKERLGMIDQAFGEAVSVNVVSFVKLLCEKGYIHLFHECYDEFRKLYLDFTGTVRARVTSAVELTESEKIKVQEKLYTLTGQSAMIRYSVDPGILGGIIIETDDRIIDGSVRRRLKEIKEVMNQ